jgi:hypothetical protein
MTKVSGKLSNDLVECPPIDRINCSSLLHEMEETSGGWCHAAHADASGLVESAGCRPTRVRTLDPDQQNSRLRIIPSRVRQTAAGDPAALGEYADSWRASDTPDGFPSPSSLDDDHRRCTTTAASAPARPLRAPCRPRLLAKLTSKSSRWRRSRC